MRTMEREEAALHPTSNAAVGVSAVPLTASVAASVIDGGEQSRRRCIALPPASILRPAVMRGIEEGWCVDDAGGRLWPLPLPLDHQHSSSSRLIPADAKGSAEARWLQGEARWISTTAQAHLAAIFAGLLRETA